jgi:DASH complex subunit DAD1
MATNRASTTNGAAHAPEKTYFDQQREILVTEIAQACPSQPQSSCALANYPLQSLEMVLQNINKLNRSLEEVTQVGNEFAPVESLWSHFENVMAKDPNEGQETAQEGATEHDGEETEVEEHHK